MEGEMRIGELSRRVGLSVELLRAWERRYGLLEPDRSDGGFRLYSPRDEARLRLMQEHIGRGLAPAQAAKLALAAPIGETGVPEGAQSPQAFTSQLLSSLTAFDGHGAHALFDRMLATLGLEGAIRGVVLPVMREIGRRWEHGVGSVPEEHFATALIQERLLELGRGWDRGHGPRAVLACPDGELHTLGLVCHGLALRRRGWTVTFLGGGRPLADITSAVERTTARVVVLAAMASDHLARHATGLRALGARVPIVVGGHGADDMSAGYVGARLLAGDPIAAGDQLSAIYGS
jgi:MerR family transcriptional regulator, light-induced transcriptional regulator